MIYARYHTLKKLVEEVGLGWVQTNIHNKSWKAHLLETRRKGLVIYAPGDSWRVQKGLGHITSYADKLAYFYTITFKGLQLVLENWPNCEEAKDAAKKLIKIAFKSNWDSKHNKEYWEKELELRAPKKSQ